MQVLCEKPCYFRVRPDRKPLYYEAGAVVVLPDDAKLCSGMRRLDLPAAEAVEEGAPAPDPIVSELQLVKGIGVETATALYNLGVRRLQDLIDHSKDAGCAAQLIRVPGITVRNLSRLVAQAEALLTRGSDD